jgi:hypothetical protein
MIQKKCLGEEELGLGLGGGAVLFKPSANSGGRIATQAVLHHFLSDPKILGKFSRSCDQCPRAKEKYGTKKSHGRVRIFPVTLVG